MAACLEVERTNIITILAVGCSLRTLSEDLESSEKFANHPEDLELSGKFSASCGSFLQSREVFDVRRSYSVGCWPNSCVAAFFAKRWSFRSLGEVFS